MKKSKITAFALSLVTFCLSVCATGCGIKGLEIPTELSVDDDIKLSWAEVDSARSYVVEIKNSNLNTIEETTSKRSYLSLLELEEGDYEIRIKAVGDGKKFANSEWSDVYYFRKEYESGCIYTLINNNTEYEVTKVGVATGSIELGDYYRGKPVTAIADAAFRGSRTLENLTVGKNVTYIGDSAFYSCVNLKSIDVPDTVNYIGTSAFQSCSSLMSFVLPESVTAISDYAFAYCRGLSSISLSNAVTIGAGAFTNCDSLESVVIPDTVTDIGRNAFDSLTSLTSVTIGSSVERIDDSAFRKCSALTQLNLDNATNLKAIGQYSFEGCTSLSEVSFPDGMQDVGFYSFANTSSLETVNIPDSVTRVGGGAFYESKLYRDTIDGGEEYVYADKWLVGITRGEEGSGAVSVTLERLNSDVLKADIIGIADSTFAGCTALKYVELPASVKYIGNYAFYNCQQLYRLTTEENGVKTIGTESFSSCPNLTVLSLGEGLTTIGRKAFYDCTKLQNNATRNIIPTTVTSIESQAFDNTGLWKQPDEYGVIYAGNWVVGFIFNDKQEIKLANPLSDENSSETEKRIGIADYAFFSENYWWWSLENDGAYTIGQNGITKVNGLNDAIYIGRGAFYGQSELTNVRLNRNLRVIEDYTFYGCHSLNTVNVPSNLTKIGRAAFYNCKALASVIHDDTLVSNPKFEGVDLSNSRVEEIGDFAFYNCKRIKQVEFGEKLKSLGKATFYNCIYLEGIEIPDTISNIGEYTFFNCSSLEDVQFGNSVKTVSDYAFALCRSLKQINLPDSLTSIGDYAFYKCEAAESLSLGKVESIGDYAFANLTSLSSVVLPESVKSIGNYSFKNCVNVQSVIMPKSLAYVGKHAFYGCQSMVAYIQSESDLSNWQALWNSSCRPYIFGCNFSEDNTFVESITVEENGFNYYLSADKDGNVICSLANPVRAGYTFGGWATQSGVTEAEYTIDKAVDAPVGTTLYAIWIKD